MKNKFRILLALTLALSLLMGGALPVLSEGSTYENEINVNNGKVTPTDAPVTGSAEDGWVLDGDIVYDGGDALDINSTNEETPSDITVTGNVEAKDGDAVDIYVYNGGSASVVVGENVTAANSDGYTNGIYVDAYDGNVSVQVGGNVEATGEDAYGLYAYSQDGASVIVNVAGDVTAEGEDKSSAIHLDNYGYNTTQAGDATVTIGGNVTGDIDVYAGDGSKTEVAIDGNVTGDVRIGAGDESKVDTDVGGSITGDIMLETAVWNKEDAGELNLTVGEGVEGRVDTGANTGSLTMTIVDGGITAESDGEYTPGLRMITVEGTQEISITGNVTVTGENSAGVQVDSLQPKILTLGEDSIIGEYDGDYSDLNYEPSILGIGEYGQEARVYSTGTGDEKQYYILDYQSSAAVFYRVDPDLKPEPVEAENDASLCITGDVTADTYGAVINAEEGAKADIVIDGTVKGGEGSLVLVNDTELGNGVTLTVWAVEPNNGVIIYSADGNLGEIRYNGEGGGGDIQLLDATADAENVTKKPTLTQNKAAEAQLQYIIRVNAEQTDMITAGGAAQEYTAQGKTWKVAHEGETVTLLLQNIPEGYEITAAYGDVAQNVKLEKDSEGHYFLTVPRGGAVELSIVLSKLPDPEPEPEPEPETPDTVLITYVLDNDTRYDHIRIPSAVGESITLQGPPERDGYTFLYWQGTDVDINSPYYKAPDPDNDFQFHPGASYNVKRAYNFVAVWKKN